MRGARLWLTAFALLALVAAGCGDDDAAGGDDGGSETTAAQDDGGSETTAAQEAGGSDTTAADDGGSDDEEMAEGDDGGGGAGTVVLGDETIALDSSRCFLEEQDAAAGGGKILFVAQASGTNADGEEISIDISRFDEDSQFTGDTVSVVVGDPFSEDAVSWDANGEIGSVQVDGSVVRGGDLTFVNSGDLSEVSGSVEVRC